MGRGDIVVDYYFGVRNILEIIGGHGPDREVVDHDVPARAVFLVFAQGAAEIYNLWVDRGWLDVYFGAAPPGAKNLLEFPGVIADCVPGGESGY